MYKREAKKSPFGFERPAHSIFKNSNSTNNPHARLSSSNKHRYVPKTKAGLQPFPFSPQGNADQ